MNLSKTILASCATIALTSCSGVTDEQAGKVIISPIENQYQNYQEKEVFGANTKMNSRISLSALSHDEKVKNFFSDNFLDVPIEDMQYLIRAFSMLRKWKDDLKNQAERLGDQ